MLTLLFGFVELSSRSFKSRYAAGLVHDIDHGDVLPRTKTQDTFAEIVFTKFALSSSSNFCGVIV